LSSAAAPEAVMRSQPELETGRWSASRLIDDGGSGRRFDAVARLEVQVGRGAAEERASFTTVGTVALTAAALRAVVIASAAKRSDATSPRFMHRETAAGVVRTSGTPPSPLQASSAELRHRALALDEPREHGRHRCRLSRPQT
jgi:hypothetical protein